MQDQQAGGVGDFMKLGLLRWLVAPSPFAPSARLGVVWYRVSNECAGVDDEQLSYLDPSSETGKDLRPLDPDLYDRLRTLAATGRPCVESLASCGALPTGTRYFDRMLNFAGLERSDPNERIVRRERWFHEAMVSVDSCSLVLLDPEEGLWSDGSTIPADVGSAEKYADMSEVGRLLARGQSVVVHHQLELSETTADQVTSLMGDIHDALGVEPVAAVRASQGTAQLFLVIPHNEQHRSELDDRLGALQLSNWGDQIRVYRWQRSRAYA